MSKKIWWKEKLSKLEEENKQLREQIKLLRKELESKEEEIERLNERIHNLQVMVDNTVDKSLFDEAIGHIKDLKNSLHDLAVENQKLKEAIALKDKMIEALKSEPVRVVKEIPAEKPVIKKKERLAVPPNRHKDEEISDSALRASKAILLALKEEKKGKRLLWGIEDEES